MLRRKVKIVLTKDILNLGEEGDICEVASGYARNYLFPKGMASLCNKAALNDLKTKQKRLLKEKEDKRKLSLSLKERLESEILEIGMHAGSNGHLFGSVTSAVIVEKLDALGLHLDRRQLIIPGRSLKETGNYSVAVKLYAGEEAQLNLNVIGVDTHGKPLTETADSSFQESKSNIDESSETAQLNSEGDSEPAP